VKKLLGHEHALPLFVSPTALGRLANARGEVCQAEACAAHEIPYMVPHLGSCSWAEVQAAANGHGLARGSNVLQVYLPRNQDELDGVLAQARALKFCAVAVTVDAAVMGKRDKDLAARRALRLAAAAASPAATQGVSTAPRSRDPARWDNSFAWADLGALQKRAGVPLMLKGVQRGDDAVRAAQAGVPAIVVSNHGGRNLDRARASLDCLVEIDAALRGAGARDSVVLMFDGGVTRGVDVAMALALGADYVGLGRLVLWGVAAQGAAGAARIIDLVADELADAMRLLGCADVAELHRQGDWLQPRQRM